MRPPNPAEAVAGILELTPRTMVQLFEAISAAAQSSVKEARSVIAVTGELGPVEDKPGRKYLFGVPLTDHFGIIFLNIPRDLAQRADLKQGDHVRALGVLEARPDLEQKLAFRLRVGEIHHVDSPIDRRVRRGTEDKLAVLRMSQRVSFPQRFPLTLSLIHSASDQVSLDFLGEVEELADSVHTDSTAAAMDDPLAIAEAVRSARGDIVALIRGGGPDEQFRVFDDVLVLEAFARKNAYRVLGLGHTGNATLLDLICEHAAPTPSLAGSHVREQVLTAFAASEELTTLRTDNR